MSDHNYDIGGVYRAITRELGDALPTCYCDCHKLWGKEGKHIVACCDQMFEDNDR